MPVLVSDTSVLIDLERGQLLKEIFLLPFEFAVPDLLYARELTGPLGDQLLLLGLHVETLTPLELTRATNIRRQCVNLSTPDTFAFAVAESRQWPLLTGDGCLRALAVAERIEIHGLLWLLDQLANGEHVAFDRLHEGLSRIVNHPRCRLPSREVHQRLARFSA